MEKEVRKEKSMSVSKARKATSELLGYVLETMSLLWLGHNIQRRKRKEDWRSIIVGFKSIHPLIQPTFEFLLYVRYFIRDTEVKDTHPILKDTTVYHCCKCCNKSIWKMLAPPSAWEEQQRFPQEVNFEWIPQGGIGIIQAKAGAGSLHRRNC